MTNNEFKQVLLDDSVLMSKQELEEIIEKELLKNESEMDADLIEYCLDNIKKLQLSEESNKKEESKKVFVINPKIWRVLVAMSVVFVFVIISSAVYFNIPENVTQLIDGNTETNLTFDKADANAYGNGNGGFILPETDLSKELESFGITPVTFPEAMVSNECKIIKIENSTVDEDVSRIVNISFVYKNYSGLMIVTKTNADKEWSGSSTIMGYESGEMININGLDILVFEQEENCTIEYKNSLTKYTFYIECDFETAKEFAMTIK